MARIWWSSWACSFVERLLRWLDTQQALLMPLILKRRHCQFNWSSLSRKLPPKVFQNLLRTSQTRWTGSVSVQSADKGFAGALVIWQLLWWRVLRGCTFYFLSSVETQFCHQHEEEGCAKVFTDSDAGNKKNSSQFQVRSVQTMLDRQKMFLRTIVDTQRRVGAHREPTGACRTNVGWAREVLTAPMTSASLNTNLGSGREGFARRVWPSMFHFISPGISLLERRHS